MEEQILLDNHLIMIRGGGDIATGVAWRLKRCGFRIIITELEKPTVIRRKVAFAEAVYQGEVTVEGIKAKLCNKIEEVYELIKENIIPVVVKEEVIRKINPTILIEATISKKNTGISINSAPFVIALGPGFKAKKDCHVVIETNRGHFLGRVIEEGEAEPNTGIPGEIMGESIRRVIKANCSGIFKGVKSIGDLVKGGDIVGYIDNTPVYAEISGILRGILHDEIKVSQGYKLGDIDPRGKIENCFYISDKALAIAGGVLEAIIRYIYNLLV